MEENLTLCFDGSCGANGGRLRTPRNQEFDPPQLRNPLRYVSREGAESCSLMYISLRSNAVVATTGLCTASSMKNGTLLLVNPYRLFFGISEAVK